MLFRPWIAILTALSAATGDLLSRSAARVSILVTLFGVFLLACGASALNQVQERRIDARMPRTRIRPIPMGRIPAARVLWISILLLISGFSFLFSVSAVAVLPGAIVLFLYNGIYTYLKRWTRWAFLPGALVGALSPGIGWVAGGGDPFDPRILAVAFFFFLWQVPHAWLLTLRYGGEYQEAGLPSPAGIFTTAQMERITFIWIFSTAVSCLILPLFGLPEKPLLVLLLPVPAFWMAWKGLEVMRKTSRMPVAGFPFRAINLYAFFVLLFLSMDRLL